MPPPRNPKRLGEDKVPPDDWRFEVNKPYEFTINLNDFFQWTSGPLDDRYKKARKSVQSLLRRTGLSYVLVPEISMPQYGDKMFNNTPRIHFHGVVIFTTTISIQQWLLEDAVSFAKIGRYQFNKYRPKYWPKYCLKDRSLFETLGPTYLLTNAFNVADEYGFK